MEKKSGYYAVIFTSKRKGDDVSYENMARSMFNLAEKQKGFLGVETVRGEDGFGITISYWETLEDVQSWKKNASHGVAQELGKSEWYENYRVRICKVEWDYGASG